VEIVEGAQIRVDGVVTTLGGADAVRGTGVPGFGGKGVVAALAVGAADRVHRGEVDHVETQLGDRRQPLRCGAQRAGDPRAAGAVLVGALGAGEHLVPGAVRRPLPVY